MKIIKGILTVKVEVYAESASRSIDPRGWNLILSCGHKVFTPSGPVPLDMNCEMCEDICIRQLSVPSNVNSRIGI